MFDKALFELPGIGRVLALVGMLAIVQAAAILGMALLFAIGIPFLLPHMHERYFYAADILSVVMAFAFPILSPAALLVQFASLLGYHAYLKMRYLYPMRWGAAAMLLALLMTLGYVIFSLTRPKRVLTNDSDLL